MYRCIYHDSLFIKYDIETVNFTADSIVFDFWDSYTPVYLCNQDRRKIDSGATIINLQNGHRFMGYGFIDTKVDTNSGRSALLKAYYKDSTGETNFLRRWEVVAGGHFGIGGELFFPALGYYSTNYSNIKEKEGILLGWGMSVTMGNDYNTFRIATSFEGRKKGQYYFHEPIKFQYTHNLISAFKFHPSFSISAKNSKLVLNDYSKSSWGVEAGAALESDFERIKYSYTTALGGYHTYELYLKLQSTNFSSFGTRYRIIQHDKFWSLRMSFIYEGFGPEHDMGGIGERGQLLRKNNRPSPEKLLAVAGLAGTATALLLIIVNYYGLFSG